MAQKKKKAKSKRPKIKRSPFGERIFKAYTSAGYKTRKAFAADLNVSYTTLYEWEVGQKRPHPNNLKMISDFTGISIEALVDEKLSIDDYLPAVRPQLVGKKIKTANIPTNDDDKRISISDILATYLMSNRGGQISHNEFRILDLFTELFTPSFADLDEILRVLRNIKNS